MQVYLWKIMFMQWTKRENYFYLFFVEMFLLKGCLKKNNKQEILFVSG